MFGTAWDALGTALGRLETSKKINENGRWDVGTAQTAWVGVAQPQPFVINLEYQPMSAYEHLPTHHVPPGWMRSNVTSKCSGCAMEGQQSRVMSSNVDQKTNPCKTDPANLRRPVKNGVGAVVWLKPRHQPLVAPTCRAKAKRRQKCDEGTAELEAFSYFEALPGQRSRNRILTADCADDRRLEKTFNNGPAFV